MLSVRFQGKPFNITVIQVYAPISNAEEAELSTVLRRPTRPSRTNTQKRYRFPDRGLECKVGSQEIPGVTGKFGLGVQNKAELKQGKELCHENILVTGNTLF